MSIKLPILGQRQSNEPSQFANLLSNCRQNAAFIKTEDCSAQNSIKVLNTKQDYSRSLDASPSKKISNLPNIQCSPPPKEKVTNLDLETLNKKFGPLHKELPNSNPVSVNNRPNLARKSIQECAPKNLLHQGQRRSLKLNQNQPIFHLLQNKDINFGKASGIRPIQFMNNFSNCVPARHLSTNSPEKSSLESEIIDEDSLLKSSELIAQSEQVSSDKLFGKSEIRTYNQHKLRIEGLSSIKIDNNIRIRKELLVRDKSGSNQDLRLTEQSIESSSNESSLVSTPKFEKNISVPSQTTQNSIVTPPSKPAVEENKAFNFKMLPVLGLSSLAVSSKSEDKEVTSNQNLSSDSNFILLQKIISSQSQLQKIQSSPFVSSAANNTLPLECPESPDRFYKRCNSNSPAKGRKPEWKNFDDATKMGLEENSVISEKTSGVIAGNGEESPTTIVIKKPVARKSCLYTRPIFEQGSGPLVFHRQNKREKKKVKIIAVTREQRRLKDILWTLVFPSLLIRDANRAIASFQSLPKVDLSDKLDSCLSSTINFIKDNCSEALYRIYNETKSMIVVSNEEKTLFGWKNMNSDDIRKRASVMMVRLKALLEQLTKIFEENKLPNTIADFLAPLTREHTKLPNNYLFLFELSRLEFDRVGCLKNVTSTRAKMLIGMFFLVRVLIYRFLVNPWDIMPKVPTKDRVRRNLKSCSSVLYYVFITLITENIKTKPGNQLFLALKNRFEPTNEKLVGFETLKIDEEPQENEVITGLYSRKKLRPFFISQSSHVQELKNVLEKFLDKICLKVKETSSS